MATTVDTLLVRVEADLSDLRRDLRRMQQDVDKSTRGVGAAFKKMGTAVKGLIAFTVAREVGRAGLALINLASDAEEMQSKSKVVFGAFRDQVVADLTAFGDAVGRSSYELEGMASSIQDTFVPMGFSRGEAAKLSTELTKLAVDVASFNNASDSETMEAFQSALVGNHETVRRFGVVITEATLKQELLRMGIKKSADEISNSEKVQARLNLLMSGTSDAHGDAEKTAGSYANQVKALMAALSELGTEIGTIFIPIATTLVGVLLDGATAARTFLQNIGILSRPAADQMAYLAGEIATLNDVITNSEAGLEGMGGYANEFGGELVNKIDKAKTKIAELKKEQLELAKGFTSGGEVPQGNSPAATVEPVISAKTQEKIDAANAEVAANTRLYEIQQALNVAIIRGNKDKEVELRTLKERISIMDKLPELSIEEADAIARSRIQLELQKEAYDKGTKSAGDYAGRIEEGKNAVLDLIDPNRQLHQTLSDIRQAYSAGAVSASDFKNAQDMVSEQIRETAPLYATLKSSAISAAQGIGTAFADALVEGKSAMQGLKDTFKSFVKVMIAKALELYVFNHILNGIFGLSGGSALPTRTLGARATGGAMSGGQPYLAGERGPELIIPNSASTALNSNNTRSAMGGGGGLQIVQNINVSAGVSQTVKAEMLSLLPRFKSETIASVADAKRRGGSFGAAFG